MIRKLLHLLNFSNHSQMIKFSKRYMTTFHIVVTAEEHLEKSITASITMNMIISTSSMRVS